MIDPIEIPENRSARRGAFIFTATCTLIGLWFTTIEPIAGILCATACGYFSFVLLKQLIDPRARVSLTRDGIEDRANGFGLVAWSDITGASIGKIQQTSFINLRVNNEQAYLARLGNIKRYSAKLDKGLGNSPISIAMLGLKVSPEDLLALLEQRLPR